jgi:uncharacterized protein YjeT (DUF2065 family)
VCALLTQMDDAHLRVGGVVSMILGALGLWFVRQ